MRQLNAYPRRRTLLAAGLSLCGIPSRLLAKKAAPSAAPVLVGQGFVLVHGWVLPAKLFQD